MVPHTDEPHPHAHLVVKTVSEAGARLCIRKATLRGWRREFARGGLSHTVRPCGRSSRAHANPDRGQERTR